MNGKERQEEPELTKWDKAFLKTLIGIGGNMKRDELGYLPSDPEEGIHWRRWMDIPSTYLELSDSPTDQEEKLVRRTIEYARIEPGKIISNPVHEYHICVELFERGYVNMITQQGSIRTLVEITEKGAKVFGVKRLVKAKY